MEPSRMFDHWKQVQKELFDALDKFSDADLEYFPFLGSWTVGQIMLHIVDTEDYWIREVSQGRKSVPEDYFTLANYPILDSIRDVMRKVHQQTEEYLGVLQEDDLARVITTPIGEQFTQGWIIWHVLEHTIHHRGELSLILGLLGREGLDV